MGKFSKQRARLGFKRKLFGVSVLVMCLCILSGTTLAYLITGTNLIKNLFSPGQVSCQVNSNVVDTVPSNVTIKNTGTVNAYIRVAVIVNWADSSDNVTANSPEEGFDYTIAYAEETDWKKAADGFWYYTHPVAPGKSTGVLIESCNILKSVAPDGYALSVNIVTSAIQATPDNVVTESWDSGVSSVNGSTLIIKEVAQP